MRSLNLPRVVRGDTDRAPAGAWRMTMSNFDNFDRRMSRTMLTAIVVNGVLMASVLGFIGWVTVKMMQHFGIV